MTGLSFDVSHLLAGALVLVSFMLLYQTRLYALLNVFALQAVVLSLSVAWQAYVQNAPHLYITAAIAFLFKALIIPIAMHRIIARLGIGRDVEQFAKSPRRSIRNIVGMPASAIARNPALPRTGATTPTVAPRLISRRAPRPRWTDPSRPRRAPGRLSPASPRDC